MKYERLTTVDKDGNIDIVGIWDVDMRREDERKYHAAKSRLAELEDKIEGGQAVILPCKVDDTVVYKCPDDDDYRRGKIVGIAIEKNGKWFHTCYEGGLNMWHKIEEIGQTVFFTKAEAEEKLRELRGEKD